MLNISKPLSASQAQTYHAKEFTAAEQNYWKQGDTIQGEWHGILSEEFALSGSVGAEEFARLSQGQHPQTGHQLVLHRTVHEYKNADGKMVSPVEHRAGWDATFSAPKSISLTALVGGDDRVREAHREAVNVALNELEKYTQARIGGNSPAETTGKFAAAKFEHDTARPVDGYAAPQLHTHVVIFNMTERENGKMRALQPHSLFESQQFATAVYQSHLTYTLRALGYEIEPGKSGAPDIKGYTQEYLDASSPRRQQIEEALSRSGFAGAEAAQIAAHNTRDKKVILSPDQILEAHQQIADEFGNQAAKVVASARERSMEHAQVRPDPARHQQVREAITFARDKSFEREAVIDERALYVDALRRGMGEMTYRQVRANFEARVASGEFKQVSANAHEACRRFTTAATIKAEKEIVQRVQDGQGRGSQIMAIESAVPLVDSRPTFTPAQKRVVEEVLTSSDRIQGLQGRAGTGKTSVLETIRQGAEMNGYIVEGLAPTSRAAKQLRDAGIKADTLQRFLAAGGPQVSGDPGSSHLYMVDESSLASTQQMRDFLNKIEPQDRVLLIGDTRQHQGVDAGKPFEQLQQAGMKTVQLDQIMRQRDPELLKAVEHLSNHETAIGVELLTQQGRITEIVDPEQRVAAIAKQYAAHPGNTLVVSPDNASRRAINQAVRQELQTLGIIDETDYSVRVLVPRNDMTGADREWAASYQPGDVLHYVRGSKEHGIEARSYAQVVTTNPAENLVAVRKQDGQQVTYDPSRLRGIAAYREIEREFAVGDKIQFTAPSKDLQVTNRDLGTIQSIGEDGKISVRMEGSKNRDVRFDAAEMRHFDHGYAVTSHSSQGLTAERVLINMDTEVHPELISSRFAYVSVSRASHEAQIFTNDASNLAESLSRDVSKASAIHFGASQVPVVAAGKTTALTETRSVGLGLGL
ncbi:MobF family relaxase [Occallatibacter riparius]|uniref:Relaxase domain-containing protein n=1 Tax=Occallatibacter riparius TaxID=1002689 RepID=A0A9J7BLN9_9BACT|nr:MobF family relaxase [Occallatibacter riparius]UWZ81806.1 relaxase domain-containing protein [Occallatibacter riparius]